MTAGTIPIYWGSALVMQTFDPAGILYVEDMAEVQVFCPSFILSLFRSMSLSHCQPPPPQPFATPMPCTRPLLLHGLHALPSGRGWDGE